MLTNPTQSVLRDSVKPPPPEDLIHAAGEVADLIRARDWTTTPLGPIHQWADPLRYTVNMISSLRFPAQVFWGSAMTQFYNDAYLPLMGEKHPDALGQAAEECWKEAWHVIGPHLRNVLKHGKATCFEDMVIPILRHGTLEEIHWTCCYSPVHTASGSVGGVLVVCQDVTPQMQAAEDLRNSEARAVRILESIGDGVIVTDAEGRINRVNPVAERLTGWSNRDARGLPLEDVFHILDEHTRQPVESPASKVKRKGNVVGLANHTILVRKDGAETPIDDNGSPILDDDGKMTGIVLVFRDITAKRAAERERDTLAGQLQQALDSTNDGVLSLDRHWRITFLNRRAQQFLAPTGDILGQDFWKAFPGSVYEGSPYVEHYSRAMHQRQSSQFEAFYPEPLNAWFHVLVQPSQDGIILFFRDITQQRQESAALRESQARLSAIYSAASEYIGIVSPTGTIIDCNRASLEFAGSTREEVIGMLFWESPWFSSTPGASDAVRQAVKTAANGQPIRTELSLTRPSGEILTFDFSITPVRNASGEVVFLVPEGREISPLKTAQKALIQSEKLAAVGRLASSIAHEINNPLESVTNLLYLAGESTVLPQIKEYIEIAERELHRVSVITNQTLRFHKQPARIAPISCDDLIDSVLAIHQGRILHARVQVEKRIPSRKPVLCLDGEIRQVLSNLIGNAIDAMPPGGGRLLIRTREATDHTTARPAMRITIADNGAGMSAQTLQKAFEPFFTTKGFAGTGLGLWISQEIVKRHRGSLRVRSSQRDPSHGTVFTLTIPIEPIGEPDTAH